MISGDFTIGPFVFEYDSDNNQMLISKGEEMFGLVDHVYIEDWQSFYEAATSNG